MSRKLFAILMALIIAASLVACNNEEEDGERSTSGKTDVTTESGAESGTDGEVVTDEEGNEIGTGAAANSAVPGELNYVESVETVYILHSNKAVNLRNADGTVFKSFNNGTELKKIAISENGEWTKVVYEEKEYYIISSGVTTLADLDAGFEEADLTLVVAATALKIRIAPDFENTHDAIGFYQQGDTVKVIGVNNTNPDEPWYKVEFVNNEGETKTGFIASNVEYFVVETEAATSTATEAVTEATTTTTTEVDTEVSTETAGK